MKNRLVTSTCIILGSVFGCNESNEPNPTPEIPLYSWTASEFSPENDFIIYNLKISDDHELYAMGYKDPGRMFAKLVNGEWEVIASVDESGILDFTFYNDTVYY